MKRVDFIVHPGPKDLKTILPIPLQPPPVLSGDFCESNSPQKNSKGARQFRDFINSPAFSFVDVLPQPAHRQERIFQVAQIYSP